MYNYRLLWRVLDAVVDRLDKHRFSFGEVRLSAIKNELIRRGLPTTSYYNADGLIINTQYDVEVALLETSEPYSVCSDNNQFTDHIKAAYGLIAMLHTIAYKYEYADVEIFKKLKIVFVHAAKKKVRVWTLQLGTSQLYIFNRLRSSIVPISPVNCQESMQGFINMMFEVSTLLEETTTILKQLEKSHNDLKILDGTKLESYLGETADVKLPCQNIQDYEDLLYVSTALQLPLNQTTAEMIIKYNNNNTIKDYIDITQYATFLYAANQTVIF